MDQYGASFSVYILLLFPLDCIFQPDTHFFLLAEEKNLPFSSSLHPM